MEREKMIEEMEAILEREQIKIANTVEEFAKLQRVGITRCNAEALCNANCRIVPEGSVVLTKEEYERLRSDRKIKVVQHLDDEFTVEIPQCEYDEMLEQVHKETARDILTELKKTRFHKGTLTYDFETAVKRLSKQYGVEIEE